MQQLSTAKPGSVNAGKRRGLILQGGVTPLLGLGCSLLSTHPVEYDTEGLSVFAWSLWYALTMIKKMHWRQV